MVEPHIDEQDCRKSQLEKMVNEGFVLDTQKHMLRKRKYSGGSIEC